MNVASGAFELQNRIADELAGAVIGDLAAARNAMDGNAGAPGDKIALVGAASQRVDVRMFEQQERVADSIELARADYRFLKRERAGVVDRSEPRDAQDLGLVSAFTAKRGISPGLPHARQRLERNSTFRQ